MKIKRYSNFLESIKHIEQPDDISCGPTCLMMLSNHYNINTTIEKLTQACGTDELTGTTAEKMKKGLEYLNLNYEQFPLKNKQIAFKILDDYKNQDYFILFRTLTKGIKHWIVCDSISDKFHIIDPWLGEYYLTHNELDKVWSPRDYDGFIVKGIK
jgi:ABC-type bacteriocin/lantibiotic exporter with double-glycine peptidase domain